MSTSQSHLAALPRSKLAPEVRSHIRRDLVAKAAVDDPAHPGWPAGAPDRQGGRFRPKDPTSPPRRNPFLARDIPEEHAKHPVPLLDNHGDPITDDQGLPLLRPADLPPEMFVREGQAIREKFVAEQQNGLDAPFGTMAELARQLANFGHGGLWDAQRVGGEYVDEYRDYATIAIGLYMAAAGVPMEEALLIENEYARLFSHFSRDELKDDVIRHCPAAMSVILKSGTSFTNQGGLHPALELDYDRAVCH